MAKRRRKRFRGTAQEHLRSAGKEYKSATKAAKVAIRFAKKGTCIAAFNALVHAERQLAVASANRSWAKKYRIGHGARIAGRAVEAAENTVVDNCVVR